MRRMIRAAALLGVLLLAGCATDQRASALTQTLNAYASAVRWGDMASARQFVDPAIRSAHPLSALDRQRYEQVKVSEYDEGAGPVPDGPDEVKQSVHIGLINVHTQTERSIVDHQRWRYDPEKKHWWLMSGLPDITRS